MSRVLVVDDSEDDHLQLRRALKGQATVVPAYTGLEAMERLSREHFDVLITDQKMPRMSGGELIRRAKANPAHAHLRCILLSGLTPDQQLVEILSGGSVYRFFKKDHVLLSTEGRESLQLAVRNASRASQLEAEGQRLTERLKAQAAAMGAQYRLLRGLVDLKAPGAMLRLVMGSLAEQLSCRAVLGLVDLSPKKGCFEHLSIGADKPGIVDADVDAWRGWLHRTYSGLSGREVPEDREFTVQGGVGEAKGLSPDPSAPTIPVFVNRDLRGVLVLLTDGRGGLEPDEENLLEVWRDHLQDALTRTYKSQLDEQRRVELMLTSMAEGVVLTDEAGAVSLINPAARRLLGLQDMERPDFNSLVGDMGLSSFDVLRQLGEERSSWGDVTLNGTTCQVRFSRVNDSAGVLVGVLLVLRDVTQETRTAARREEFLHIIGHELRSPLTSIGGVLDLLYKHILGPLSERQTEYVDMARDSCARINDIIKDLLDLAKFEQGQMPITKTTINLEKVVKAAVNRFEPSALKGQVSLSFDCLFHGLLCEADAARIGQVVTNLMSNALKFTPANGSVSVEVFAALSAPHLYLVSVHNKGDEIHPNNLDRIFDKFQQVDAAERRSVGGTGLGLSICRNIVEGHGGRIWVESGRGQGTTFLFSLPCRFEGPSRTKGAHHRRAEDAPLLLLACDDAQEGYAMKAVLIALDYRVRVCTLSCVDLEQCLGDATVDAVVLLDVEGAPSSEVLVTLAGHTMLPVITILPPGTARPATVEGSLENPPDLFVLRSTLSVVLSRRREQRRRRVLVVDQDTVWASDAAEHLDAAGYLAFTSDTADAAIRRHDTLLPDLVLLDPNMSGAMSVQAHVALGEISVPVLWTHESPDGGTEVTRNLEAPRFLHALRAALAEGLQDGAGALVALPGAREVQREVQRRIQAREGYAVCAVTMIGLDRGIEAHGLVWGHRAMAHVADLIYRVLSDEDDPAAFLGRQGDEALIFLVQPDRCDRVCEAVTRAFERLAPLISKGTVGAGLTIGINVVVDKGGDFERFGAVQAEMIRLRGQSWVDT